MIKERVEANKIMMKKIEDQFLDSKESYSNERNKLTMYMTKVSRLRKKNNSNTPVSEELRAPYIMSSPNSAELISQVLLRFKTVTPNSKKFAKLLKLVINFYNILLENITDLEHKVTLTNEEKALYDKSDSLRNILLDGDIF